MTQLKKVLNALPGLCQDKNYKYINDIISTNTKLTKVYFLFVYLVRTQRSSTHHENLRFINPIIGLEVLSGTSPIDIEMIENPLIFNLNLQEQVPPDYDQESKLKLQELDKLIANKNSLMTIILDQCYKAIRTKFTLCKSYEDNSEAEELTKFLVRVYTVCNVTNNQDILFGSRVTKITEHNFQPTLSIKELLAAYPTNDAIWDHTNSCNVSIDTVFNAEITASIHNMKESISNCRKLNPQEILPVTIFMSHDDDKSWFGVHKDFDS